MILLDKEEEVDEIKVFTAKGERTQSLMTSYVKRIGTALLAMCTHYDRLWKERRAVPSKIKQVLKEVLALALATELKYVNVT